MKQDGPAAGVETPVRRLAAAWGAAVALLLIVALGLERFGDRPAITDVFLHEQDYPVLLATLAFWLGAALLVPRMAGWRPPIVAGRCHRWAIGMAVAAGGAAVLGARFVYRSFALSMDEFMALFDSRILGHGQALAPVDPAWRPFIAALQPIFRLDAPGHQFWASSYLPANAAFLAVAAHFGSTALAGGVWAAVAVVATYLAGRRLWPDRADAAVVAALFVATSSQVLITAMTPYAMSAHLALNMVWLCLFLRGGRTGHLAAGVVAAVACGLHQIIFHPLFAAPFVMQLWLDRRWGPAAFHTAVYAAAGVGWIVYWSLLLRHVGVSAQASAQVGGGYFAERVAMLLANFHPAGAALMAKNLLRLIAWQNPLAIALAILSALAAVRCGGTMRALVLGFGLTVAAMFILLPFQGHGWGYRYVHGLIGGLALVAAFGWIRLTSPPRGVALATCAAAFCLLVMLPLHALQVSQWVTPYARASAAIARTDADVVVVDQRGVWYGSDLVRNDPYLTNRPKVMALAAMDEAQALQLCRNERVAIFDQGDGRRFGIRDVVRGGPDEARLSRLRDIMRAAGCP